MARNERATIFAIFKANRKRLEEIHDTYNYD